MDSLGRDFEFFPLVPPALWNNGNKRCPNKLKFWEASKNHKSSICWKFQLSISCGDPEICQDPLTCGQDDLVINVPFVEILHKYDNLRIKIDYIFLFLSISSIRKIFRPIMMWLQKLGFVGTNSNFSYLLLEFMIEVYRNQTNG